MRANCSIYPDSFLLIVISCFLFSGCALFYPTQKPINTIYCMKGKEPAATLIIMLPGGGDRAADFRKNDFFKRMELSGIGADAVAVDAHLGYYFKKNLLPHLYEDVIVPAKQKGYKNIWLLGISMGGLGAVICARHYPDILTGLILLAPFLGYPAVLDEIDAAGGLAKWSPPATIDENDYEHIIWKWLKGYTNRSMQHPRLLVGYGSEDRWAKASAILAEILPQEQVYMIPGGHDWETWGRIFDRIGQAEITLK